MPIHQADLHGSKRDQEKVDPKAVDAFFSGECDLADGLGVGDELISGLRRQALALYESGRFDRAIKVVLGVVALGRIHPADPLLLARCYDKLGNIAAARECEDHANRMMQAMGIEIPPAPSELMTTGAAGRAPKGG